MISCIEADLTNELHASAIITLLDSYACDFMGGGEPLAASTREHLIEELQRFPTTHIFLAKLDNEFVGLANCFEGFSTFACKRLLNIHDFCTLPTHRRKGVGAHLMMYITEYCRSHDFCKITLEVLEGNHAAKAMYKDAGFEAYVLDEDNGGAEFWQKKIE